MSPSTPIGWGESPWGSAPWGGSGEGSGGPLPFVDPFNIYYVGDYNDVTLLLTYDQVIALGGDDQFPIDDNNFQDLTSGGTNTGTAAVLLEVDVPQDFTMQFVVSWPDLPADFSDIVNTHSYFGTFCPSAACMGLFFSQEGIAYTGSVHFDTDGNIVLDTPVMPLPNSQTLVGEDELFVVLVAVSWSTGTVYVYVTPEADYQALGHQLKYILPVIPSSSAAQTPLSLSVVSVRCNPAPVTVAIQSIALGAGVLIPAIPPSADPGPDQAIQLCEILQLDGTASTDPQGASLTYYWELIDAPPTSQYIYTLTDGFTYPLAMPTGFTNLLYSASLAQVNALSPIQPGGVLVVQGIPYSIVTVGTDMLHGFYAEITEFDLPDSLSSATAFSYLPQNGINTPTSPTPTFYPDVPGFFKFQLTVYDGAVFSVPTTMVVNVVESAIARGCIPDLSFVWNYLSDFWSLVDGTERITAFWQGLAQVAAAELLTLWQVNYGKSLRDIQRTFQRRWLHYDLLMQENPNLIGVTSVSAIFGGLPSILIPNTGISGVAGTHLDLQLSTRTAPVVIPFVHTDPYTPSSIQQVIQNILQQYDSSIVVNAIDNRLGTSTILRIDADYPITVLSSSTSPLYPVGETIEAPSGTAGAALGTNTYYVDSSLQFLNIPSGSFLCVDGVAYRIARVVDVSSDPFYFQRITLLDPLPIPCGTSWSISGTATSTDLDFWNGMCEAGDIVTFQVVQNSTQAPMSVTSVVLGSSSQVTRSLPVDATPVGVYLAQPSVYTVSLASVLRRKYIPLDPLIVDIPLLQELIVNTDDTQVLRRNVDFFFTTFRGASALAFVTPVPADAGGPDVWEGAPPPARMWAETSYLDNRPTIEANFGIPAEFTLDDLAQLPSNIDYLSSVQGLWYAYWNGPTVFNLRVGTQILLGLPFAEQTGTIVEIRSDFSQTQGRILVQDASTAAIVRSYTYPVSLSLETNPATGKPYAVGDTVQQFSPLVTGVLVEDYVSNPTWFQGYLEQGDFFEVEKFFKFLVQVDASAFNLQALLFCQTFINRIKPTYTYPLFVVLETIPSTSVSVSDSVLATGTLYIYDGACTNGYIGVATMFDQPNSAGGGWRNQFDQSPFADATWPNPTLPILWAFDKKYLCPEDAAFATLTTTIGTSEPIFDSVFMFDLPVYNSVVAEFDSGLTDYIPIATPGKMIGEPMVLLSSGTLNSVSLEIRVNALYAHNSFALIIKQNNVTIETIDFTTTVGDFILETTVSLAVVGGDTITCFIHSTAGSPSDVEVLWENILVTMGQSVAWSFDTDLTAGTYVSYRAL
jgi:hypothetical protein